jgi:hypothetical protein
VRAAVASAALLLGACVSAVVTPIGPSRPSRPAGCAVDLFPTGQPPYPYTPIAKVRIECDPVRRNTCQDQLRAEACRAGADAVVGFKESVEELTMFVEATLVAKAPAAPERPAVGPGAACDPICSPGFACRDGQCIPQCNPPCEAGEICTRKRVCEPAPAAAPPATPPEL